MLQIKNTSSLWSLSLIALICWSLLIGITSYFDIAAEKQYTIKMAKKEILTIFSADIAFRRWAAMHGGIYVPITEKTQPNPYLSHITNRDITTPSGKKLTLLNPAYMLRQVMSKYGDEHGITGHITSLNVLNPINAPDAWEHNALEKIEAGASEVFEIDSSSPEPSLRLIRPLIAKRACLTCHANQGYKVGDIRGGISLTLPLGPYLLSEQQAIRRSMLDHLLFWLIGSLTLLIMTFWSHHNIIQQNEATKSLRKSELDFRAIFNNSPVPMTIVDKANHILSVNRKFTTIFGYTRNDIATAEQWWTTVFPEPAYRKTIQTVWLGAITEAEETGKEIATQTWDITCKDGTKRTTEFNLVPLAELSVVTMNDITERQRAEETRIRLETAIDQTADSIVITDQEGKIQYVNPSCERITGYTSEELIGKNPHVLNSGRHTPAFYREMWETLTSGQVWKGHFTNKKKDGSLFDEEATISPVVDRSGVITNYVAVKRDVTELLDIEKKLRQAQKMEAIGTLAGGIAHDFNNILGVILGYADLAREDSPPGSSVGEDLDKVIQAGNRAKDLARRILTFSRQDDTEYMAIQPAIIIQEAIEMLRPSLPTTIEITQHIAPETGHILADPTQIHQILINLCTNAFHAMEETGGKLDISLQQTHLSEQDLNHEPDVEAGNFVQLSVCDSGPGIPPEIKEKIFEPYFTTKKTDKGTGMGLAIIHGIVKSYGGFISVASEPDRGTTVHVFIPVVENELLEEPTPGEQIRTGQERILFIDDEEILCAIGKKMLKRLGYQVTVSSNSLEALQTFQNHPDQFDLIITDQTMPGMTGTDLARQMMHTRPDIPIILCTGYSTIISAEKAKEMGIKEFALKPLTKKDLARLIRKALGAS